MVSSEAAVANYPSSPFDRAWLTELTQRELRRFADGHPRSAALFARGQVSLIGGVPMPWMMRWAGGFPPFAARAAGARITDVDGHDYVDLCLGDTGAMTGHGPPTVLAAIAAQAERGITTMLPTEDSIWVAEELARRFGVAHWLFTLSATDANRAALRIARQITGRPQSPGVQLLLPRLGGRDVRGARAGWQHGLPRGNVGPPVDPARPRSRSSSTTSGSSRRPWPTGDVACVLAEPAMTNMGIILPDPGYHQALRELTRAAGTLLIIDETHTLSAGPGGCTAAWDLDPDMVTLGKAIGSGVASGALGIAGDAAGRMLAETDADYEDTGGVGGTLAGNALSLAAMRATLGTVLTAGRLSADDPAGRPGSAAASRTSSASPAWAGT